jgi:hypothetical protein
MNDLTAISSDVRMLELSLQPTKYTRGRARVARSFRCLPVLR